MAEEPPVIEYASPSRPTVDRPISSMLLVLFYGIMLLAGAAGIGYGIIQATHGR